MTAKTTSPRRVIAPRSMDQPYAGPWPTPPWTTEECVQRIEAMSQRISGYIQFMCTLSDLNGTSAEAKDKAILAFYERMVVLERQLGRIQEEVQLE
jgi:hypothetical protein